MDAALLNAEISLDVKRAQASVMLQWQPTTLLTNAGIAASALFVSMLGRGLTPSALFWFFAVLVSLVLRFTMLSSLKRYEAARHAPQKAINLMALGAFASGTVWAALPFSMPSFNAVGADSAHYLIMCGIATGAVLMGVASSRISLAFALPPLVVVMLSIAAAGQVSNWVVALNVLALIAVVTRSARMSETFFVNSVAGKLRATALANSLVSANADMVHANHRLEALANSDPLTGLANRAAFNASLAGGIAAALASERKLALLVLDLDRFKSVNDTLGHTAGDALLVEISDRLRLVVDGEGIIARLGGDEFAIIFSGPDAPDLARKRAEDILERGRQSIVLEGQPIGVGISIGLAVFPDHADTAEGLFSAADMALYRAKDAGRRQWREFEPAFRFQADRRRQIEGALVEALSTGGIEAWFQPQVDLDSEEITGFEALVRWRHPDLGAIAPPEIVAAAQAPNLSHRLTALVAEAACALLARLPALGLPRATVAISVSPREFDLYSVPELLDRITAAHAIDRSLLEIEITEEAILDTLVAGEQLRHIERSGYKLAVDDFGAGHSSLVYLVQLNVDRLKLDRRFITGIDHSRQNQEIVAAMIGLGRALSMDVVVEGVERREEADTLKALGSKLAQGYLFGRPMPAGHIPLWLEGRKTSARRAVA